jgi:hypothetical protein
LDETPRDKRAMRVIPNRVVYCVQDRFVKGLDNRYTKPGAYIRLGDNGAKVIPGEWRHPERWEMPMTSNELGYSCHHCQGFITRGEPHVCREIKDEKSEEVAKTNLLGAAVSFLSRRYHAGRKAVCANP